MALCIKNWRAIFFKLKTLIHKIICVENSIDPESIKDYNTATAMTKTFVWRKRSQQLSQIRKIRRKGIEYLLKFSLTFLFFFSLKLR